MKVYGPDLKIRKNQELLEKIELIKDNISKVFPKLISKDTEIEWSDYLDFTDEFNDVMFDIYDFRIKLSYHMSNLNKGVSKFGF